MPRRLTRGEKVWRLFGTAAYEFRKFVKKVYSYVYYVIFGRHVLSVQDLVPSSDRLSYSRLMRVRGEPREPVLVGDVPSPVTRSLEEVSLQDAAPPADAYIASVADLVATHFTDASPASDSYVASVADLVATAPTDIAAASDAYVATVFDRLAPPTVEAVSVLDVPEVAAPALGEVPAEDAATVTDAYAISTSELQAVSAADVAAPADAYLATVSHVARPEVQEGAEVSVSVSAEPKSLVTCRLDEAVAVEDVQGGSRPSPEYPGTTWWLYVYVERAVVADGLQSLVASITSLTLGDSVPVSDYGTYEVGAIAPVNESAETSIRTSYAIVSSLSPITLVNESAETDIRASEVSVQG